MDATPPHTFDADLAGRRTIDPYAAIVDQLQHTVMQLVRATLERARRDAGLAIPLRLAPRSAAPALPAAPQDIGPASLSQREREVLQRIAAGDSNKMIARALDLSPHTVKRHVANILDKLGARSRSQAAAWLQRAH
jgi:LuxR family maltose regulon positive regulatory protein